ncbi:hypothetical protein LTR17_022859 [Elasticomyces elasticus]|nr:hypothetical protein LTR17_022859 [Elasticomyces elasticus]
MDSSYEHMDLRSVKERLRVVRLQIEEAKLMSIVQRFHDVPTSQHPDPSYSQSAGVVQAESHTISGSWAPDAAVGSQPTTGPFDVLSSTLFEAIADPTLAVTNAYADLDPCMAVSNYTSTIELQQDMMATNIGPNETPLIETGDHCEPEPVDWSWLNEFTAGLSSSTQYSPPNDRAGIRSEDHPNNHSFEEVGINYGIGMGQTLHALPASPHSQAKALVREPRTVVSLDSRGKGRGVLQEYPATSKRRKTSNIPGYSCFSSIPEGTKARRQTTRAAQENTNKLRKREFSYVTTTKPHWSRWATGRPDEYDSLKAIELLAIAYSVNHKAGQNASPALPEAYPGTWSHFASDVLGLVDGFSRRKKFWEDRNSSLILTATMDLLMGICLDMALHIQELSDCHIVFEDARIYSALIERCKFCVREVMSFRKIMLQRLDTTESSYFEEAAFAILSKVTPRSQAISQAMDVLSDMRMHVYRIDRCLSSKELLLLQSLHLNDAELLRESLTHGAHPYYAREAHHNRLGAMEFALDRRKEDVLIQLRAAAWEVEGRHEASLNAVAEAPQRTIKATRRALMAYAQERRKFDVLHSAYALSGSISDAGGALCLAVIYELDCELTGFSMTIGLLDAGVDVDTRNANGLTALMVAIQSTSPNASQYVELLLAHGADVNARAPDGRNVATITAQCGIDHGLGHLYLLVAYGAESPAVPPMTLARRHTLVTNCKSLMLKRMEMSFCKGPWTQSASTGGNDVVCLLLDYRAVDTDNELRVMWWRVDEAEARLLLERAADDYSKAVRAASAEGHEMVVRRRSKNKPTGYSNAIRAASIGTHEAVVRLLMNSGGNLYDDLLDKAVVRGDGVVVRALLDGLRSLATRGCEAEVPLLLRVFRLVEFGASLIQHGLQANCGRLILRKPSDPIYS